MRIHITILAALLAAGSLSAQDTTAPSAAMTLEQCRELALQSNKQLMISRARIQKAHYQNREAFAAYLPAFDFVSYVIVKLFVQRLLVMEGYGKHSASTLRIISL